MRISEKLVNPSLENQITKTFYQLIVDLKDQKEVEIFLSDFLNENELEGFIKRLAISYWLKKGRTYANIRDNLKVSTATISAIRDNIGSEGVQLAIKKIEAEEWANQWVKKINNFKKK